MFGFSDLAKVIDAGVCPGCRSSSDEIGNENGGNANAEAYTRDCDDYGFLRHWIKRIRCCLRAYRRRN